MANFLKADCSAVGSSYVEKDGLSVAAPWTIQFAAYVPTSTFATLDGGGDFVSADLVQLLGDGSQGFDGTLLETDTVFSTPPIQWWTDFTSDPPTGSFTANAWVPVVAYFDGTDISWTYDGSPLFTYTRDMGELDNIQVGGIFGHVLDCENYYIDNIVVKDSGGGTVFADDFESGNLSAWTSVVGACSVVSAIAPCGVGPAFHIAS